VLKSSDYKLTSYFIAYLCVNQNLLSKIHVILFDAFVKGLGKNEKSANTTKRTICFLFACGGTFLYFILLSRVLITNISLLSNSINKKRDEWFKLFNNSVQSQYVFTIVITY